MEWLSSNTRINPASEGEFLKREIGLNQFAAKRRWRILGFFAAYSNGAQIPIADLLVNQNFENIKFVGVASTLLGQQGLHSQCLWYRSVKYDWFWVRIDKVECIDCRADQRFRGGVRCIWLTSPVAEYVMAIPHTEYHDHWVDVLNFFRVAPIEAWPKQGCRPDWWPLQSSGEWPYQRDETELARFVSPDDELKYLTELLSAQGISTQSAWRRRGPNGDHRFPGQKLHNLGQLLEWDVEVDGGIKPSQRRLDHKQDTALVEAEGSAAKGTNKKRSWQPRGSRHKRVKASKA